jgi:hypothetical protein
MDGMNDLPVITQTEQPLRRAHCSFCGGKGNNLKAEWVRSAAGTLYRIPENHVSCKQSALSLSLSMNHAAQRRKRGRKGARCERK